MNTGGVNKHFMRLLSHDTLDDETPQILNRALLKMLIVTIEKPFV